MESKKDPRIDLQKKRPLFLQIGLIVSLSFIMFAFEYKQFEQFPHRLPGRPSKTLLVEIAPLTEHKREKPKPPDMRQVITRIEITDKIKDDIDVVDIYWPDHTGNNLISYYVPKLSTEPSHIDSLPPRNIQFQATFPGGDEALFAWLDENVTYPEPAKSIGLQGIVFVRFVVELDGSITHIGIERGGVGGGCEEEAMSAVKKMPGWNPARQGRHRVRSTYILPIRFMLIK